MQSVSPLSSNEHEDKCINLVFKKLAVNINSHYFCSKLCGTLLTIRDPKKSQLLRKIECFNCSHIRAKSINLMIYLIKYKKTW